MAYRLFASRLVSPCRLVTALLLLVLTTVDNVQSRSVGDLTRAKRRAGQAGCYENCMDACYTQTFDCAFALCLPCPLMCFVECGFNAGPRAGVTSSRPAAGVRSSRPAAGLTSSGPAAGATSYGPPAGVASSGPAARVTSSGPPGFAAAAAAAPTPKPAGTTPDTQVLPVNPAPPSNTVQPTVSMPATTTEAPSQAGLESQPDNSPKGKKKKKKKKKGGKKKKKKGGKKKKKNKN